MTARKRSELESFWRAHLDGWRRSDLNQRAYCELHGLASMRLAADHLKQDDRQGAAGVVLQAMATATALTRVAVGLWLVLPRAVGG